MMKRLLLIITAFAAAPALLADGAGGLHFGSTNQNFPFVPEWELPHSDQALEFFGGYGYGVGYGNAINGGFGMAITGDWDDDGEPEVAGGLGGVISGYRLAKFPVNLNVVSWTGFGGISVMEPGFEDGEGYFVISQEIAAELGLPVFRWFMPTVYAGYQWIFSVVPGDFM